MNNLKAQCDLRAGVGDPGDDLQALIFYKETIATMKEFIDPKCLQYVHTDLQISKHCSGPCLQNGLFIPVFRYHELDPSAACIPICIFGKVEHTNDIENGIPFWQLHEY